ncbi:sugar phosphate isomerase/epimerase [Cohnella endophytica]|uniref:Sugar phosphate isomerase/epimerase n=1 Tax=Cohnella endophytica TaxID=2419778 RepID=A0A494XLB0_9BACL|nr:sugar phosphate isomerase/epimerase [Cohnella endophytica]RKP51408.1 sugar phosphate isomerase/epimerase [Cohnella endophytica]
MVKPKLGIQLYSVRDMCQNDFLGTIRQIAEIGYRNAELAGIFGHDPKEVRKTLQDNGLNANSAHFGLNLKDPKETSGVRDHVKRQTEIALELGIERYVVPWYPLAEAPTEDDVARFAATLSEASDIVTSAGLEFGYHNHAVEFKQVNGKAVIDHLMERLPRMGAQFDLGWVKLGGQDPSAYLRKYAGRVSLVHAKDFTADGADSAIGLGIVDWDSALAAAEEIGVEYVIVEQEAYEVSSLESAKRNLAWFRDRGWA